MKMPRVARAKTGKKRRSSSVGASDAGEETSPLVGGPYPYPAPCFYQHRAEQPGKSGEAQHTELDTIAQIHVVRAQWQSQKSEGRCVGSSEPVPPRLLEECNGALAPVFQVRRTASSLPGKSSPHEVQQSGDDEHRDGYCPDRRDHAPKRPLGPSHHQIEQNDLYDADDSSHSSDGHQQPTPDQCITESQPNAASLLL